MPTPPEVHSRVLLARQLAPDLQHEAVKMLALGGMGEEGPRTQEGRVGRQTQSQLSLPTREVTTQELCCSCYRPSSPSLKG